MECQTKLLIESPKGRSTLLFYLLKWVSIQEDQQPVSAWVLFTEMYLFFRWLSKRGALESCKEICVFLVNIDCGQQYNVACFSMTPLRKETKGREEEGEDED